MLTAKTNVSPKQTSCLTYAKVTEAIRNIGFNGRLARIGGELYFVRDGQNGHGMRRTEASRLNHYSLEQWLTVCRNSMADAAREHHFMLTGEWPGPVSND